MLRNEYLSLLEIELSRKGNNGNLVFTCNGCQQIGDYVAAIVAVEDEENDKYHVVRAPQSTDHKCWVSGNEADIKKAKSEMCNLVLEDPTRSIQIRIYTKPYEASIQKGRFSRTDGGFSCSPLMNILEF